MIEDHDMWMRGKADTRVVQENGKTNQTGERSHQHTPLVRRQREKRTRSSAPEFFSRFLSIIEQQGIELRARLRNHRDGTQPQMREWGWNGGHQKVWSKRYDVTGRF